MVVAAVRHAVMDVLSGGCAALHRAQGQALPVAEPAGVIFNFIREAFPMNTNLPAPRKPARKRTAVLLGMAKQKSICWPTPKLSDQKQKSWF